ncbi:MAG: alpha/beta fold hydrolase [Pseudomonadota bacterium]
MKKPALIFLPGLLNDARLWQQQIDAVSDLADCQVGDLTQADSISALASLVLAHAPEGQFALAGLSMGGYVALEIMRQAPQRVLALALLDTSARPDTPESTAGRRDAMALADTDFQAVLDNLLPKLIHPSHLNDKTIVDNIMAMGLDLGKEVFQRQQTAIIGRKDSRPYLSQITCPTLVLCGREDRITPVEIHEEIVAGIATAELKVIDNAGHLSALDQAAAVSTALRGWLTSLQA